LYYGPDAWGVAISSLFFLGFVFLVVLGQIQGSADDALRKKREERLKEIFQSGSDAELPTVETEPLGLYLRPGRQCYLAISSVQVGAQQIAEIASTSENSIGVQKILTIGAKETTSHKATREEFVYGQNGTLFILDDSLVFVTASSRTSIQASAIEEVVRLDQNLVVTHNPATAALVLRIPPGYDASIVQAAVHRLMGDSHRRSKLDGSKSLPPESTL